MSIHESMKKYKCGICTKTFDQENGCLSHIQNDHMKKEKSLKHENSKSQCGEVFKNTSDLLNHIKNYHKILDTTSFNPTFAKLYTCYL